MCDASIVNLIGGEKNWDRRRCWLASALYGGNLVWILRIGFSFVQRLVLFERRQLYRDPILAGLAQFFAGESRQHDSDVVFAAALICRRHQRSARGRQVLI